MNRFYVVTYDDTLPPVTVVRDRESDKAVYSAPYRDECVAEARWRNALTEARS